ncbi:MAG: hypothetical protein WCE87_07140 [Candidatus Udaeobacter sp.]
MSTVYLAGQTKDGRRCWFNGTYRDEVVNFKPVQIPQFDDEHGKEVSLEFAQAARKRWLSDFGIIVSIAIEKYGQPIPTDDQQSLTERPADHPVLFVPLVGGGVDGLGYHVRFSPERKEWHVRADSIESMLAQHRDRETLWAKTPEDVVNKILAQWSLKIAVPIEDPQAAVRAAEQRKQQALEAQRRKSNGALVRPGDRAGI